MKTIVSHLTVNGTPLCQLGSYDRLMHDLNITCGHVSIAAATRAKKKLQTQEAGVKVVAKPCPHGPTYEKD